MRVSCRRNSNADVGSLSNVEISSRLDVRTSAVIEVEISADRSSVGRR